MMTKKIQVEETREIVCDGCCVPHTSIFLLLTDDGQQFCAVCYQERTGRAPRISESEPNESP